MEDNVVSQHNVLVAERSDIGLEDSIATAIPLLMEGNAPLGASTDNSSEAPEPAHRNKRAHPHPQPTATGSASCKQPPAEHSL